MSNSDVFDLYVKIAEEAGLVSLADDETPSQPEKPKESAKLKRYKKSPYPRVGSDDISTIEALYGVKPDNSVKYEFNIMEAAHPKPVVIAPSYDRIDALVENEIERQNININMVSKPTDGVSTLDNHKYAKKNLVLQLVRLANDLDNAGHEELATLADSCIQKFSEKKKSAGVVDWLEGHGRDAIQAAKGYGTGALIGGILGGIVGAVGGEGVGAIPGFMWGARMGGITGGLTASIARTAPKVINISHNAQDTIEQINDLVEKIPDGNPERKFLTDFQKELNTLSNLSSQYNDLVSTIQETNHNSTDEDAQTAHILTTNLLDSINRVSKYISSFNDRVNRKVYQEFLNNSKLLTPVYEFISDDVEDVQDSIHSLLSAINNFKIAINQTTTNAKDIVEKTQQNQESKPQETTDKDLIAPEDNETNSNGYDELAKLFGHAPNEKELEFFRSLK